MSWIVEDIKEILDSGDPTVRKWFLVESYFLPPTLSLLYVIFVKKIGPALMQNRKPFDLRKTMVLYNLFVVTVYIVSLVTVVFYCVFHNMFSLLCTKSTLEKEGSAAYIVASFAFALYAIKYIEYMDTVFFILRKKDHLVTNLHVIHHATLPIISWGFLRTEFSGYQMFPAVLNGFVHTIMYSYYGLAALGPEMRKYLWWKKYLTILQMSQFVIIILFTGVIIPLSGCHVSKYGLMTDFFFALLFFTLFYNFYTKTYKPAKVEKSINKTAPSNSQAISNGENHSNGHAISNELQKDK